MLQKIIKIQDTVLQRNTHRTASLPEGCWCQYQKGCHCCVRRSAYLNHVTLNCVFRAVHFHLVWRNEAAVPKWRTVVMLILWLLINLLNNKFRNVFILILNILGRHISTASDIIKVWHIFTMNGWKSSSIHVTATKNIIKNQNYETTLRLLQTELHWSVCSSLTAVRWTETLFQLLPILDSL